MKSIKTNRLLSKVKNDLKSIWVSIIQEYVVVTYNFILRKKLDFYKNKT